MSKKETLMRELESAYNEFYETIKDVSPEDFLVKWQDGRWGLREIAAHHAGWLGKFAGDMERMARGEQLANEDVDVEAMDETFAEHTKGKVKDEVLFELQQAVNAFLDAAEKIPDDLYEEDGGLEPMFQAAGITHFRQHLAEIQQWRDAGRSAA